MCRPGEPRFRERGFTYLGLLYAVALSGVALAAAGTVWRLEAQREREADLLFAGDQIRQAVTAYRDRTPSGQQPAFPRSMGDLLDDRRWPIVKRHLRRVYRDPMTGGTDWGLIAAPGDAGFMGVYSPSAAAPLKRGGFDEAYEAFAKAGSYRDWRFAYAAEAPASAASAAGPGLNRGKTAPGR